VSTALVRTFLAEDCPDARPVPVPAVESSHRAAALLAGGVDAAAVDLNTWLWIAEQMPGRFHVLSDFSRRWPGIKTTGVHVNVAFAERSPRLVDDYLRALRAAGREAEAERALVVSEAAKRLGPGRNWSRVAEAYHGEQVWVGDVGLTDADVAATLSFFRTHAGVAPTVRPESVVHSRFLVRVADGASDQ
jgi:ABC-type nitrate/sulfonate/bicarbonate transport system substrate-binding protein